MSHRRVTTEKVRIALILLTIAITVGPPLAIILAYQNNLLELVIPPELEQIVSNLEEATQNGTQPNFPNQTGPVDVDYDPESHTATITFQLENPLPIDVALNSVNGTVQCDDHGYPLGTATLKNPVQMTAGKPATLTALVTLTQQGRNHIETAHQGETSTSVSLVDTTINADGVVIKMTEPLSIGEVPLT